MEVSVNVKISAEEFFKVLEDSLLNEINECTHKNLNAGDIKNGFTYHKQLKNNMGQVSKVKVTITKFIKPSAYSASFTDSHGSTCIDYKIIPMDSGSTITYSEFFDSDKKLKKWNYKLMTFIKNRKNKKRTINFIRSIESFVLSN